MLERANTSGRVVIVELVWAPGVNASINAQPVGAMPDPLASVHARAADVLLTRHAPVCDSPHQCCVANSTGAVVPLIGVSNVHISESVVRRTIEVAAVQCVNRPSASSVAPRHQHLQRSDQRRWPVGDSA